MVSKKIGDEIATVFNDGKVISNHPLVYQGYCVVKVFSLEIKPVKNNN